MDGHAVIDTGKESGVCWRSRGGSNKPGREGIGLLNMLETFEGLQFGNSKFATVLEKVTSWWVGRQCHVNRARQHFDQCPALNRVFLHLVDNVDSGNM